MSRSGLRFQPPAVALGPECRWTLLRGFGPLVATLRPEPSEALRLARCLDLAPRIAARLGRVRLREELGEAAEGFGRDHTHAVAAAMAVAEVRGRVLAAAQRLEIPVALLKFAALEATGRVAPGSRSVADLDLLVPSRRGGDLQQALLAEGFRQSSLPPPEQQWPALESITAPGVVEVHRVLLGVHLAGGRSATFEDLREAGLLAAASDHCALVPTSPVLVAHTIVHGLAQHGWAPQSYPFFRMIADLLDLGLAGEGGSSLLGTVSPWIEREVRGSELEAVTQLVGALARGRDLTGWGTSETGEALLLRHAVAGLLDPGYAEALRLGLFRRQPSDHGEPVRLGRLLARTVWLTRSQIDAIYGPQRHAWGYWARRLVRPFDLLARFARSALRTIGTRRRRYTPGR